jgi:hypothetical protein
MRNNRLLDTPWGRITLTEAAERANIPQAMLSARLINGWSVDDALRPKQGHHLYLDTPWGG